jgi:hypothetical protein
VGLIQSSIANGSRECAPDDRLRDASRRMDATHGLAATGIEKEQTI